MVFVYDMQGVDKKAMHFGDCVFAIGAGSEYIVDEDTAKKLIKANDENINELLMKKEIKSELLAALKEDETFVIRVTESGVMESESELNELIKQRDDLNQDITVKEKAIKEIKSRIENLADLRDGKSEAYNHTLEDNNRLITVASLAELIDRQEKVSEKAAEDIKRLQTEVTRLTNETMDENLDVTESEARLELLKENEEKLVREWEENYKTYYNIDKEYDVLSSSDDELKARFKAMVEAGSDDARAIEDKRELMNTISTSMERSLKNIEKRGTNINKLKELEKENRLFAANEDVLYAAKQSIEKANEQIKKCENAIKDIHSQISKLEGSMEYAVKNIRDEYGEYREVEASLSEIVSNLEDGEALLARLEAEYKACEQEYREYFRQQGYMIDLYKDVKRIVVTNDISLEKAVPLLESKDKLRDMFEDALLRFDKSTKQLERAKNELLKFKGNTASALEQMEVYELAVTIRDDVVIPDNYDMAKELLNNLSQTVDYIKLERDRVEKSLADMETIKLNFEEQCLQRCLDVKTELDKLPKLSRIIVDGEPIQMVGLTIPYVKEEFLRQRMSDYIDRIVAQADDYDSDKDRMKFIRSSLALKKLFGVIVTDMNGIKLSLYKRERIKEQSRYLRYEEAVGSTGQSQGIYIQFLVAVINYISGMYHPETDTVRTKTVFIDNPFGAAKDVYIWEPIFAMLKANRVQLIVPARGATPAITGRFDVNYILGQQMSGGKQLTVVTDYTSQVDQEELEYQELSYEQGTFDFV
jgi:chromosome segregation ATPase